MTGRPDDTIRERIVEWARSEPAVRALALVGSRGRGVGVDRLSDYDLVLFVRDVSAFTSSEGWLRSFGRVLVMLPESYELMGRTVPTRLVQYGEGPKVDFTICDVTPLRELAGAERLPEVLDAGYEMLVDKDGWGARLAAPSGRAGGDHRPTEAEFRQVVNEFWWEAAYVARNLARGEMVPALYSRECVMRFHCLVPMLEWWAHLSGRGGPPGPHGRGLSRRLEGEEWERFSETVSGAGVEGGWNALWAMTDYFMDLTGRVARAAGFDAQDDVSEAVRAFLEGIRAGGGE